MKKLRPGIKLRNKGTASPYAKYGKRPYNYTNMYRKLQEENPNSPLARYRKRRIGD